MQLRLVIPLSALVVNTVTWAGPKEDVSRPIKAVVNSVRYGKDLLALKNFAGEEQGKQLLGDAWATGTPEQRKEFVQLFHQLFGKMAFPKFRQDFEHLDTILYDEPTVEGDRAHLTSTILIDHPLKKQEIKVKYALLKAGGSWMVLDVTVLGDSMLEGIRDDQIAPIMKEGGWEHLLQLMRAKNRELAHVVLK